MESTRTTTDAAELFEQGRAAVERRDLNGALLAVVTLIGITVLPSREDERDPTKAEADLLDLNRDSDGDGDTSQENLLNGDLLGPAAQHRNRHRKRRAS